MECPVRCNLPVSGRGDGAGGAVSRSAAGVPDDGAAIPGELERLEK